MRQTTTQMGSEIRIQVDAGILFLFLCIKKDTDLPARDTCGTDWRVLLAKLSHFSFSLKREHDKKLNICSHNLGHTQHQVSTICK